MLISFVLTACFTIVFRHRDLSNNEHVAFIISMFISTAEDVISCDIHAGVLRIAKSQIVRYAYARVRRMCLAWDDYCIYIS